MQTPFLCPAALPLLMVHLHSTGSQRVFGWDLEGQKGGIFTGGGAVAALLSLVESHSHSSQVRPQVNQGQPCLP